MFHQAQNFTISPSDFNVVYGNQTVIQQYPRNCHGYENEIDKDVRKKRRRQRLYLDDVRVRLSSYWLRTETNHDQFKKVRRGDIMCYSDIFTTGFSQTSLDLPCKS
ncbi:hypothetical protein GYMLUDRAFT_830503 [Collybiopsis luxurians FD-317 M1]|uniref:Uncharacterized protein n=1 Tax=Collybiopsis luxurians FD-317 M1 TaxID=944289 RepID=A0A0D0C0Q1_9AGAR|nr:hypothetical protein GYMLUDRAFT_830503 [Collybiopsis luxurians FD-317 M1]